MRTDPLRGAFAGLALALFAAPAFAQDFREDLRDTAQLVVSERLRTFALARGLASGRGAIGTAEDLKRLLSQQGFYMDGNRLTLLQADQSVYPLLSYVPNMNGGVENDTLVVAGIPFTINPDQLARGGVAFGLSYDGQARVGWSPGRYVEARAQLSVLHAPSVGLTRKDSQLSVCSRNHITGWTFADLCFRQTDAWMDLGQVEQREAELSLSHLIDAGVHQHEVGISLRRSRQNDQDQDHIGASLDSVGTRIATRLSFELGEALANETGSDKVARGEIRWNAGGHIAGLALQVAQSAHSYFLGQARQDTSYALSALYQIDDSKVVSVGYSHTDSTVDFFDSESIQMNISFKLN